MTHLSSTDKEILRYVTESTTVRQWKHSSTEHPYWSKYLFFPVEMPFVCVKAKVQKTETGQYLLDDNDVGRRTKPLAPPAFKVSSTSKMVLKPLHKHFVLTSLPAWQQSLGQTPAARQSGRTRTALTAASAAD